MTSAPVNELDIAVRRDLERDVTLVSPTGMLSLGTAGQMRSALVKCMVECPCAVVVDLSACLIANTAVLTIFPAVAAEYTSPAAALILVDPKRTSRAARGRA